MTMSKYTLMAYIRQWRILRRRFERFAWKAPCLEDSLDVVTPGSSTGLRSAYAGELGGLSGNSGPALRDLAGKKPVDDPGHLDGRLRS
jgi:hypothetical protein